MSKQNTWQLKNKSIDTHCVKSCIPTKLNKVPLSHLALGNQGTVLKDKQDSGGNSALFLLWNSDTKAVTLGTDSFAAYGVQRGSVLAVDRVQWQATPEPRSEGAPIAHCCPVGGWYTFFSPPALSRCLLMLCLFFREVCSVVIRCKAGNC